MRRFGNVAVTCTLFVLFRCEVARFGPQEGKGGFGGGRSASFGDDKVRFFVGVDDVSRYDFTRFGSEY
jgi:hypothetical protein